MNIEVIPLEIIGLKSDLQATLHTLRRLGCVQIDNVAESPTVSARPLALDRETLRSQEDLNFLVALIEGLIEALHCRQSLQNPPHPQNTLSEIRQDVEQLMPAVQALTSRRDRLEAELASLPRYETTLRKLLPIIPRSAHLPGNVSVGVLISRAHVGVMDSVGKRVLEMTGGRADIVACDIDVATRAMLIVFPAEFTSEIEALLGHSDLSRLRLPGNLGEGPPDVILASLLRRMSSIPEEIQKVNQELDELTNQWGDRLVRWRDILRDEADVNSILIRFGETDMTFVLVGWVPENSIDRVQTALKQDIGEKVLVQLLAFTPEMRERAPVILKNLPPARPFESLVNLLALPRYGHMDPTSLMAFFLPIFFGLILGDIGYGLLLLVICLIFLRKKKVGMFHDLLIVLSMGSGWAILFGFLYGEVFGTLGEQLGLHALWLDRTSAEDVTGLLLMSLAVGAIHITLGLILGVWEAIKEKSRSHLLERGGMLVGLMGLFLLVGIFANMLPGSLKTPAIAGLIVGIVLLGASMGWLGIIMGPIEFISLIGNVLSYLRIAAIGLASVYLAKVANDVAGMVGNVIVGIILALLIHALNLVMGTFSPTIQSLRLHYVEFFRKFYEGGGKPFEPYKSHL